MSSVFTDNERIYNDNIATIKQLLSIPTMNTPNNFPDQGRFYLAEAENIV